MAARDKWICERVCGRLGGPANPHFWQGPHRVCRQRAVESTEPKWGAIFCIERLIALQRESAYGGAPP